jgi:hypothetical protein
MSQELTYDSQGAGGGDRWERGGETLKYSEDMQNAVYIVVVLKSFLPVLYGDP